MHTVHIYQGSGINPHPLRPKAGEKGKGKSKEVEANKKTEKTLLTSGITSIDTLAYSRSMDTP